MPISRQNIIRGPGVIRLGGATAPWLIPEEDWEANAELKTFEINTNVGGLFDVRKDDVVAKITFKPLGLGLADIKGVLFPGIYQNPDIGASVFGATDTPCICQSKAGKRVTFHCAALTRPPDLFLSATKTMYGQAEITAIVKNNSEPGADNSIYSISDAPMPELLPERMNVFSHPCSATWGPLEIITETGWTISVEPEIEFVQTDEAGTIDGLLKAVKVTAKCRPVNLTEAQILNALSIQGTGAARGHPLQQNVLQIDSHAGAFTILQAILIRGPIRYGSTELRAGEIAFAGTREEGTDLNGGPLFSF